MFNFEEILKNEILVSFIINLSVFIIVWRVLGWSLFSAFSDTFEKRREMVEGQKKRALALRLQSEEIAKEYELRISTEKAEIKKIIEKMLAESEVAQRKHIQSAREVAARELDEARKKIMEEAERVRESLRKEVPSIALRMASKVIGREVSLL